MEYIVGGCYFSPRKMPLWRVAVLLFASAQQQVHVDPRYLVDQSTFGSEMILAFVCTTFMSFP